ncbi:MAG: hypothetical protein ACTHWW_02165 [Arthrobacter sp.]|uniref:hypothetical protein n=1 Tax=unclassified Arthrobacter TaxID=235627 RepID=UPI00264D89AF|nr:hypothetical protein [Micrococcaceae bacterium]MDN5812046.1 hypothetical protein [Micrococcaceae bacterium]MDN5824939.1 hypothetical protein [Micrococcaceae bacterium]MDN5879178.1 hypothetical protein [Micrococcaceae bacterium]MDN5886591.1 hypothetical protein [Micrococcaceae bacterium]
MPAPDQRTRRLTPVITGTLVAIVTGVLAAVFGTLLQGQIHYLGDTPLPWGAVLALLLAGSFATVAGLYVEKVWVAGLCGLITYGLVAWTALDTHNHLLIGWSSHDTLPGPALAAALWTYGIVVSTVVALLVTAGGLRTRRR